MPSLPQPTWKQIRRETKENFPSRRCARQPAVESPIEDEILPSGIAQRRVARTTRSETFQSPLIERGTYAHSKIKTTRRVSQVRRLNLGLWGCGCPTGGWNILYSSKDLDFVFLRRVAHPCGFGFCKGGSFASFLISSFVFLISISPVHFSADFHSRNKPITPLSTPSNLSTSLHPIRIRPSRSNESVSKTERY